MKRNKCMIINKTIVLLGLSSVLMISFTGCTTKDDQPVVVSTSEAPEAIGPYSQAQVTDGFVYTSGQIGIDPSNGQLGEDLETQCEQVFENISAVLEAAGSDMGKVVKTTLYITDMNNFSVVNGIYEKYFYEPYPARSCVEVSALPKGAFIECEVIAIK